MKNITKESSNTGSTTIPTNRELPYYFDSDLFELQVDASPSQALRERVSWYLMDRVSYERVMTASRFRLLHCMLAQQVKLEVAR